MTDTSGGGGGEANGKVRDYGEIETRLQGLDSGHVKTAVLGEVEGYSIYTLEFGHRSEGAAKREILLTGGVHGDEPAGVEAVLRFSRMSRRGIPGRVRFSPSSPVSIRPGTS